MSSRTYHSSLLQNVACLVQLGFLLSFNYTCYVAAALYSFYLNTLDELCELMQFGHYD